MLNNYIYVMFTVFLGSFSPHEDIMGHDEINCMAETCTYKEYGSESYCPFEDEKFVASNIGDGRKHGLDVAEELLPTVVTLCDSCSRAFHYGSTCQMCGMQMIDDWIGYEQWVNINKALGEGTVPQCTSVCRMCVDYKDMDDFDSVIRTFHPSEDKDIIACGRVYRGKWLPSFGDDTCFYAKECPTQNKQVVNAKVRKFLAQDLVRSIKEAHERRSDKAVCEAEETKKRLHEVAKTIHRYIPGIAEKDAVLIVTRNARKWIDAFPRDAVHDVASLFRVALAYEPLGDE